MCFRKRISNLGYSVFWKMWLIYPPIYIYIYTHTHTHTHTQGLALAMLWHQWHLLEISSHSWWQIASSTTNVTLSDLVLAAYLLHLATVSAVTRASVLLMLHPLHLLEMDSSKGGGKLNSMIFLQCVSIWFTSFWIYKIHRLIPAFRGLLYWGPWRMCKGRLWKWVPVSIRALFWGAWGDAPFLGVFKKRVRFLFIRRNFIAEFKRHVKEGSGNGQLCP